MYEYESGTYPAKENVPPTSIDHAAAQDISAPILRTEVEVLRAVVAQPAEHALDLLHLVDDLDFHAPQHRRLFTHIKALTEARVQAGYGNQPLNPMALLCNLQSAGDFRIGWPVSRALIEVVTNCPASYADTVDMISILKSARARRALTILAAQFAAAANSGDADDIALAAHYAELFPSLANLDGDTDVAA